MVDLDNSNEDLITGAIECLRTEMNTWPLVSGEQFSNVENVWGKYVPDDVEGEFPRGIIDVIGSEDTELSVDLSVSLRENTLRFVVFGENAGEVERLVDEAEQTLKDSSDSYTGDWTFREIDGSTELVENEGIEGKLRYNRSVDAIYETIRN